MMYTDVRLTILATCVNDFFSYHSRNSIDGLPEPSYFKEGKINLALFDLTDVRYGIVDLPTELGIPYSQIISIPPLSGFKEKHLRFDSNGEHIIRHLDYKDKTMSLDVIKGELDHAAGNAKFFHEFMKGYIDSAIKQITPLPWTHQEQYRKVYLTKELLTNGQARNQQTVS